MSRRRYAALVADSKIHFRGSQAKILRTHDDNLVKLFRPRRLLSSAWLYPHSLRFARNSRRLRALSVPSVEVKKTYFVPAEKLFMAVYPMLNGHTLLSEQDPEAIDELARFLVRLHHKGVFFRALHLGNVLRLQDGRLALIDVTDVAFRSRPLEASERFRNFQHLFRRAETRRWFGVNGALRLIETYAEAAQALPGETQDFAELIDQLTEQVHANFERGPRQSSNAFALKTVRPA